jgi:hypothetical protein
MKINLALVHFQHFEAPYLQYATLILKLKISAFTSVEMTCDIFNEA